MSSSTVAKALTAHKASLWTPPPPGSASAGTGTNAPAEELVRSRALLKLHPTSHDSIRLDFSEIEQNAIQALLASATSELPQAVVRPHEEPTPDHTARKVYAEVRQEGQTTVFLIRFGGPEEPCSRSVPTTTNMGLPAWRLRRVVAYIDANMEENISLKDLASHAGLSPSYFAVKFKETTGQSPHEYVVDRKISAAKLLLLDIDLPIIEIALSVGFQSHAHFSTAFRRVVGTTPTRWRHENYRDGKAQK